MSCKARVEGGQWVCNYCGTRWDLDDSEPPECLADVREKICAAPDAYEALNKAFDDVASNLHDDATRNIKEILK